MKTLWGLLALLLAMACQPEPGHSGSKPDWKVTELTAERIQTTQTPLRIKVVLRVKNVGTVNSSGQFVTRLECRRKSSDPWQHLFDWHGGSTAAGGGARYEKSFDFSEGGGYTFRAMVDPGDAIDETSETNNTKSLTKSFDAGTPDLTIRNLGAAVTRTLPNGSRKIKVEWDLANIGDGAAKPAFVIVLEVSRNGGSYTAIQRYTKSNLAAGASQHYSKEVTYADFNTLVFKVTADDSSKVHESNEGNNFTTSAQIRR